MKKNNLPFLTIIGIGLIIALGGLVAYKFTDYYEGYDWMYIGLWISELAGFFMLLANGTFIKTKYFRYFKGVISIVLIAALLKILHYSVSDTIMITGFIGLILIYFLSFIKKPIKKRLDYLKLGWVISAYSIGLLKYFHMVGDDYQILPSAIMWLAIIDYLKTERERRTLFQ